MIRSLPHLSDGQGIALMLLAALVCACSAIRAVLGSPRVALDNREMKDRINCGDAKAAAMDRVNARNRAVK